MKRNEFLAACAEIDGLLMEAERGFSVFKAGFIIDRVFPLALCDLDLGARWYECDLHALTEVHTKRYKDDVFLRGIEASVSADSIEEEVAISVRNEMQERGYTTLPNGLPLSPQNLLRTVKE